MGTRQGGHGALAMALAMALAGMTKVKVAQGRASLWTVPTKSVSVMIRGGSFRSFAAPSRRRLEERVQRCRDADLNLAAFRYKSVTPRAVAMQSTTTQARKQSGRQAHRLL